MAQLEELLQKPFWRKQAAAWRKLTAGDILFRALCEAVGQGAVGQAGEWLNSWQSLVEAGDDQTRCQWHIVRVLVWCAEQAIGHPDFYRTEINRVCFALADTPEFIKRDETWAWVCLRTLLGAPNRCVEVAVAAWDERQGKEGGLIASLVTDVLAGGAGQTAHHPADAFCTRADGSFSTSMADAWATAWELIQKESGEVPRSDGRWRLLRDGSPLEEACGRSASGAAALAWYHALRGTVPDPGVIVLAEVDSNMNLRGVGGVSPKVKAIAADGRFDTIIVAGRSNQSEAEETLCKLGKLSVIRVVNLNAGTLEKSVEVRSQVVEEVLAYLGKFAERLGRLPQFYPQGFTFDEIRVKVRVSSERLRARSIQEEQEARRRAGLGEGFQENPYPHPRGEEGYSKEDKESIILDWDEEVRRRLKRGVILGDPGFGKSWLLKYEGRKLALEEAEKLKGRRAEVKELTLPFFCRLQELAEEGKREIKDRLIELLKRDYPELTSKQIVSLFKEKRENGQLLLLFDGLDEVSYERRGVLEEKLLRFSENYPSTRILIASRIVGYGRLPIPLSGSDKERELELVAFNEEQMGRFVTTWFKGREEYGRILLEQIHQNPPIHGVCQIPLMLSLICLAYDKEPQKITWRRSEVYRKCLDKFLRRVWREEHPPLDSYIHAKLGALEDIACRLFMEGKELFHLHDLEDAVKAHLRALSAADPLGKKTWDELVNELTERDGVLVKAGEGENAPYLFLHLTIQEYLTACALAKKEDYLGEVKSHLWDFRWHEVIVFLSGVLENATPLIELIDQEKDDIFATLLLLQARCVSEGQGLHEEQVAKVVRRAIETWNKSIRVYGEALERNALLILKVLNHGSEITENLLKSLGDQDADVRRAAAEALGQLGVKEEEVIQSLLMLLGPLHPLRYSPRGKPLPLMDQMMELEFEEEELLPPPLEAGQEEAEGGRL